MILNLVLISKSKTFLLFFLYIFNSYFQKNQNLVSVLNYQFSKTSSRQIVTILKSPHINKKSKKKFIFHNYKISLTLVLSEKKKPFYIYKLICLKSYIDFKIKLFLYKQLQNKSFKSFVLTKFFKTNKQINKYMFILDSYGENLFTTSFFKQSLGSSVGRAKD